MKFCKNYKNYKKLDFKANIYEKIRFFEFFLTILIKIKLSEP